MRISEQTVNTPISKESSTGARASSSDRFSRLIDKSEKERERRGEGEIGNQETLDTEQLNAAGLQVQALLPVDTGSPIFNSSSAPYAGSSAERLVAEMVQKIQSIQGPDGARHIDIQFNSKTLEGLHVHIERRDGTLAVQFSAKSEAVASLLSQHVGELRAALESHGMKVANIAVSKPSTTGTSRYAQPRRGSR